VSLQEIDYFIEKSESQPQSITCPTCKHAGEYQIRWIRRTKKASLPPGGDEVDRAKFKNARDYMIRVDDTVSCVRCRKRIEITSKSVVML
jgi:hypothetical protein